MVIIHEIISNYNRDLIRRGSNTVHSIRKKETTYKRTCLLNASENAVQEKYCHITELDNEKWYDIPLDSILYYIWHIQYMLNFVMYYILLLFLFY